MSMRVLGFNQSDPWVRWWERTWIYEHIVIVAKLLTPQRLAALALGGGLCYSLALSYMPLRLLHSLRSGDMVYRLLKSNATVRRLCNLAVYTLESNALLRVVSIIVVFLATFALLPVLIALEVLTEPPLLRSVLALGVAPVLLVDRAWAWAWPLLPSAATLHNRGMAAGCAVCTLGVFGALGAVVFAGHLFCPQVLHWVLGAMSPLYYMVALGAALALAALAAVMHLEGHRKLNGTLPPPPQGLVHAAAVAVVGMAAAVCVIALPLLHPQVYARLRLLHKL